MTARRQLLRPGAYLDSVVLLELQRRLIGEPGIVHAAAVMSTPANQELLAVSGLVGDEAGLGGADDLVVVVVGEDEAAAEAALARVDELLAARRPADANLRPRSLESALRLLPSARWVVISVPGPHAAEVAWRALDVGRHVFLFSDHVSLADEVALKRAARQRGLLLLGPDCGTAVIAGVGLGFANRVGTGPVGLIAASGTGLQAVCCHLDGLGVGVSQAFGTGGRDLSAEVGGIAAQQALGVLAEDPATRVIVLVSKPAAPAVVGRWLARARGAGKPVVVWLLGTALPARRLGGVWFAASAADAAELAADLAGASADADSGVSGARGALHAGAMPTAAAAAGAQAPLASSVPAAPSSDGTTEVMAVVGAAPSAEVGRPAGPDFVRALCGGGTLATHLVAGLQLLCEPLFTNVPLRPEQRLDDSRVSQGHCVVDLGADELTAGKPHPMLDPQPLVERLLVEAADPEVGLALFDVVLGDGTTADPAAALAPAVAAARRIARDAGRELGVVALLQGTAGDPQDVEAQARHLAEAGATVCRSVEQAVALVWDHVAARLVEEPAATVLRDAVTPPLAAVTIGVDAFHGSLLAQGARAVRVDWRPPAGGDGELMALLRRMR